MLEISPISKLGNSAVLTKHFRPHCHNIFRSRIDNVLCLRSSTNTLEDPFQFVYNSNRPNLDAIVPLVRHTHTQLDGKISGASQDASLSSNLLSTHINDSATSSFTHVFKYVDGSALYQAQSGDEDFHRFSSIMSFVYDFTVPAD